MRQPKPPRPQRPRLALLLAVPAVAGLAMLGSFLVFGSNAGRGPIVVISIDTLRADRVGAYGYRAARTPAIDRLAREGVLFERALSHSPQTLPSHASMLTGLLPFQHGVRDNVGFALGTGMPLLPEMLRGSGYRTAGFVSAFVLRPESGVGRGFDHFDADLPPAPPGASMGSLRRAGRETVERARHWLSRQRDGRFFLFVHLYEPHRPWHVPAAFASADRYDGAISYADSLVGNLIGALRDAGFYEPALVLVLSDHGEGLGDHGEEEHGVFLYDEATRVPFIVKLPGARQAGRRVREPVQLVDLLPTLAEAAGAPVPAGLEGRALLPLLERAGGLGERGVYAEALYPLYHFGWSPIYSLTDARYRFVLAPTPELYDLERDPREHRNIARERAATAVAMRRVLEARVTARIARPSPVSEEERARFRALGYIGHAVEMADGSPDARPDPKENIHALERYRAGVTLMGEQRVTEAIDAFRVVVRDHPSMLDVWVQLGDALSRAGRDREAIDALKRAIALDPGATEAVLAVAAAELRLGRPAEAASHARAVMGRAPARSQELLARAALARGQLAEAMDHARQAQLANPGLPLPAYIEGAIHHARRQYAEAAVPLRRAAAQADARRLTLPDLRYTLGDTLAHLGLEADAEREFVRELEAFPGNGRARASLALLYHTQGRHGEATRVLDEMVSVSPTPESYQLAVRTLAIVGARDQATALLARGLRTFPGNRALLGLNTELRARGVTHGAPH